MSRRSVQRRNRVEEAEEIFFERYPCLKFLSFSSCKLFLTSLDLNFFFFSHRPLLSAKIKEKEKEDLCHAFSDLSPFVSRPLLLLLLLRKVCRHRRNCLGTASSQHCLFPTLLLPNTASSQHYFFSSCQACSPVGGEDQRKSNTA